MVGEILYFLHRHVRIATPIALVIVAVFLVIAVNLVGQAFSLITG